METAFTSTRSINDGNRNTILRLQSRLAVAQQEVASGRLADAGETLGARTAETVSLRQHHARLTALTDTNSMAQTRLSTSQAALSEMVKTGQDFVKAVLLARSADGGAEVSQDQGQVALISLMEGLNTTVGGQYLFGGINSTVQPIADYYSTPTSAARTAVDAAFLGAFGTTQSDPANDGITPAAMQTFLDTTFSAMFDPAAWTTNWSSASDTTMTSRISTFEDIETSASANEAPFRKLAKAYTMIADIGVENLNKGTFELVADQATKLASEAIHELSVIQSRLGASQERIVTTNTKLIAQRNILNEQIQNLEAVDPFEASTRVTTLLTQLETAYSLTARVQRLTILNYL